MDKAKIKKATPIAVTLVIALTPQLLAFCDNRAKAYEVRKAAKEARLEAEESEDKAEAGYKALLPAVEGLQAQLEEMQNFMLEESRRVNELVAQVEELRVMIPKKKRPEALKPLSTPYAATKPRPSPTMKLPKDLDAAHQQEQKAAIDAFMSKRGR